MVITKNTGYYKISNFFLFSLITVRITKFFSSFFITFVITDMAITEIRLLTTKFLIFFSFLHSLQFIINRKYGLEKNTNHDELPNFFILFHYSLLSNFLSDILTFYHKLTLVCYILRNNKNYHCVEFSRACYT